MVRRSAVAAIASESAATLKVTQCAALIAHPRVVRERTETVVLVLAGLNSERAERPSCAPADGSSEAVLPGVPTGCDRERAVRDDGREGVP
jgi:hypothetical protein